MSQASPGINRAASGAHGRLAAAAAAGLVAIGLAAAPAAMAGTTGQGAGRPVSATFTGSDLLTSVAAASTSNAWAVGGYFSGSVQHPLIEHWNGRKWLLAASPAVGGSAGGYLLSVAVVSAKSAWAVGAAAGKALIEHWDGSAWHLVAPAAVRGKNVGTALAGVAVVSAKSAWAVGSESSAKGITPLIEHWNGARWSVVAVPDPGGLTANAYLTGVTASKAGVWAAGTSAPGNIYRTVMLALVGGKWRQLRSPNPSGLGNWLGAVSAAGSHVLAAGFGGYDNPVAAQALVMHKLGPAFRLDATPGSAVLGSQPELYGVAATSSGGWAVGRASAQTLILRERSGHWRKVASPTWPSPATSILEGVTVLGPAAWAVGQYNVVVSTTSGPVSVSYSLILRWTGTRWVRVRSPNR